MYSLSVLIRSWIGGHGDDELIPTSVRRLDYLADRVEEMEEREEKEQLVGSAEALSVTPQRPTDYRLVTGYPDDVEADVKKRLADGWDLFGTPLMVPISADGMATAVVFQAMTRTSSTPNCACEGKCHEQHDG